MDRHEHLNFTSPHPNRTERPIVYSHGLRVKRICSEKEEFLKHLSEMKLWLIKEDYPKKVFNQELGKEKNALIFGFRNTDEKLFIMPRRISKTNWVENYYNQLISGEEYARVRLVRFSLLRYFVRYFL